MNKPRLYIIAGCNGAGKTTASVSILPRVLKCLEFVNADEIAKGLSPFRPEEVAIEAGRLMLQRVEELLDQRSTFAIETTLATRSYRRLVLRAHELGYRVILLFFWLPSPEMAEQRVAARVAEGGHDIPKTVIHRRYWLGIQNLFSIFAPIVDRWSLYDNSGIIQPIVERNIVRDKLKLLQITNSCPKKTK
ncbi:MAG: zeta toxin family protein [Muribaculaceae bacterium]|nr:zeta toxin family protein [Muribaculaceae bacterium]